MEAKKEREAAIALLEEIKCATVTGKIDWRHNGDEPGLKIGHKNDHSSITLHGFQGCHRGYAIRIIADEVDGISLMGVEIDNMKDGDEERVVLIVDKKQKDIKTKQIVTKDNTVARFVVEMQSIIPLFNAFSLSEKIQTVLAK